MPKLIIDNIPVEVPPGTSVLEAARSVGITIPHFCYHPALAIAAACRLCAVKLLDGPVKGIQMSCSLPAQDGMVVSTTDPEALKLRSLVIEWLMINHPHDCPVCDEGGECLLQDFTIAGGHGRRRYQGKKRTHVNQYLGEGIEHEMNRCIQCYRCVRFYQDYAGGTDFGVTGSAGRVYFGRSEDGALESPFSGNLVDICPTGVFTDKTGRFRARYWDYQFAPSVCQHCSIGCNTAPQAYHRELIKIVARRNDQVNGWFICDRGRFDKKAVNDPARPRLPLIDGQAADYDAALDALAIRVRDFLEVHGPESLALVGSSRLSLEGCIMLGEISRNLAGSTLCYYADKTDAQGSLAAIAQLNDGNAASLLNLQQADCIVLLSVDLMNDGPMLAPAIRKASLAGAKVFELAPTLGGKKQGKLPFEHSVANVIEDLPLQAGAKGVIICGTDLNGSDLLPRLAATGAKLILLQPGPNGFGAALLSREHGAVSLSEAIASKKIKGAICIESDIPADMLEGVSILACADWRTPEVTGTDSIFLPTTTWIESDGTSINFEGRAQRFQRVMRAGLPLRGLDAKYYAHDKDGRPAHAAEPCAPPPYPPRVHRGEIPGGQERDAWKVLARLLERLGGERIDQPLSGKWEKLQDLDPEGGGVRVLGW
jgi:NADH-quinone oxidoreductase subunit G